jgi:hypothetical protein
MYARMGVVFQAFAFSSPTLPSQSGRTTVNGAVVEQRGCPVFREFTVHARTHVRYAILVHRRLESRLISFFFLYTDGPRMCV